MTLIILVGTTATALIRLKLSSALFVAVTIKPGKRNANVEYPALWVFKGIALKVLPLSTNLLLPSSTLLCNTVSHLNTLLCHLEMKKMADLEEDDRREDQYAQNIAERESWLRSFGMTPYTTPDEFLDKINKENIESRKTYGMFCSVVNRS